MSRYDVIVIGAGHNGLVAAILLAEHGLRVAVMEQRYVVGGLSSASVRYGVWRSDYAYTVGLMPSELITWLGLEDTLYTTDPSWVDVYEGEIWLRWWTRTEHLLEELKALGGTGAAEMLKDISDYWKCMRVNGLYYTTKAPSRDDVASVLEKCRRGLEVFAEKTSREVLSMYLPEELWLEFIYPVMLDANAFTLAYFNQGYGLWRLPKRAFRDFNTRLYSRARKAGVELWLGTRVEQVAVVDGRATGVYINDGRLVEARAILYAGSIVALPRLLGDAVDLLDKTERSTLESVAETKHYVTRIDVYVKHEPKPPVEKNWKGIPLYSVWGRIGGGEVTYPTLGAQQPIHVVQFSGVILTGNPRDVLELLPGVDPEAVVDIEVRGWETQERYCGNTTGDPNHIPMNDPFLYDARPLPGWGNYRTPIEGLYHGSASSYPGGQVTGVPGVNAALRILADLGVKPTPSFLQYTHDTKVGGL